MTSVTERFPRTLIPYSLLLFVVLAIPFAVLFRTQAGKKILHGGLQPEGGFRSRHFSQGDNLGAVLVVSFSSMLFLPYCSYRGSAPSSDITTGFRLERPLRTSVWGCCDLRGQRDLSRLRVVVVSLGYVRFGLRLRIFPDGSWSLCPGTMLVSFDSGE